MITPTSIRDWGPLYERISVDPLAQHFKKEMLEFLGRIRRFTKGERLADARLLNVPTSSRMSKDELVQRIAVAYLDKLEEALVAVQSQRTTRSGGAAGAECSSV